MKPAPFEYHRPTTVEEATNLLAEHSDAEVMAGNQSLGIVMANRLATPERLIDINRIEDLSFVEVSGESVSIGAMARHRDIERSPDLRGALPVFPEAAEQIAGPSVRSRGTLGGSLGEADPAGNYPTVTTALDGVIHLASADGAREVPAGEFFVGYMTTDRTEEELITRVTVDRDPFPPDRAGMAFLELKPAAQTWPTVSAAAAVRIDNPGSDEPWIEEARIALANAADVPLRVPAAEEALEGDSLSDTTLDAATEAVTKAADPTDELHADAEFKREVAGEYASRSLRTAYGRACE